MVNISQEEKRWLRNPICRQVKQFVFHESRKDILNADKHFRVFEQQIEPSASTIWKVAVTGNQKFRLPGER